MEYRVNQEVKVYGIAFNVEQIEVNRESNREFDYVTDGVTDMPLFMFSKERLMNLANQTMSDYDDSEWTIVSIPVKISDGNTEGLSFFNNFSDVKKRPGLVITGEVDSDTEDIIWNPHSAKINIIQGEEDSQKTFRFEVIGSETIVDKEKIKAI